MEVVSSRKFGSREFVGSSRHALMGAFIHHKTVESGGKRRYRTFVRIEPSQQHFFGNSAKQSNYKAADQAVSYHSYLNGGRYIPFDPSLTIDGPVK
ncbi:LOW QUALITY PROTEIN: hypothetical protein YC2023_110452 [Brassica napus]